MSNAKKQMKNSIGNLKAKAKKSKNLTFFVRNFTKVRQTLEGQKF